MRALGPSSALLVSALLAAGCGGTEQTYAANPTAACLRADGYRIDRNVIRGRSVVSVSKGNRFPIGLVFLKSVSAAKKRDALPPLPPVPGFEGHTQRRGNVFLVWATGANSTLTPTKADFAGVTRCLRS